MNTAAKCQDSSGSRHTNIDRNPRVRSLDGPSWKESVDLNNKKLKNEPDKFPQTFKDSWKTWLAVV